VRRALDEIALVEIVGPDAGAQEFLDEDFHDLGIVVHALEQHGLVAERDAGVGEAPERVAHFGGQFPGVVDVDADPERVEFLEHGAEFGRDPLRQEDGDPAADAEKFDVLDGAQSAEKIFEARIGKQERVAAGKEDVADFGVLLQVVDGAVEIELEFLFADAAEEAQRSVTRKRTRSG
jgi:hypothetical protein